MTMMLFTKGPNGATRRARQRQSHNARFRDGVCLAAARALTGAQLYLQGNMTLSQAAISTGSNVAYVMAAILLIKAGDMRLIRDVVDGHIPMLRAAEWVKAQVQAIQAIQNLDPMGKAAIYAATGFSDDLSELLANASSAVRTAAAEKVGTETIWDDMIVPLIPNAAE